MSRVSHIHRWGADVLRQRPGLLRELLSPLRDLVPAGAILEVSDPSSVQPYLADWRADAVLLVRDRVTSAIVNVIVVEFQLEWDDRKLYRWPCYQVILRDRHAAPTTILVVAIAQPVADRAAEAISLDRHGSQTVPVVVTPAQFPRVADLLTAQEVPQLVAMSLIAHPGDDGVQNAMVAAWRHIDEEDPYEAVVYTDFVFSQLDDGPDKQKLEEKMQASGYQFRTSVGRAAQAEGLAKGIAEGRVEGIAEGRVEGRVEGIAEGRVEGRVEGQAASVLRLVEHRKITLTDDERTTILDCTDSTTLDRWLVRAVDAVTAADIFDEGERPPNG